MSDLFSRNAAPLWDGSLRTAADLATFMEGNDTKDHVIRRENLESDVLETLMRIGIHLGSQDRNRIWDLKRTNVSDRELDPAYYYDRESVALVSQREQLILRRYSYEPPTP